MKIATALDLQSQDIVALVGAGGKTTTMMRLGQELTESGWGIILTTTTMIWEPAPSDFPGPIILEENSQALIAAVAQYIHKAPLLLARNRVAVPGENRHKLRGIDPTVPGVLRGIPGVRAVIVEADGARGRSIKAPAAHEPVIPPDSTVVVALVGIEAVGQPLCDTIAHRWEVIAHLLRIHEGDILTPSRVAELLSHDAGGRKGIPPTSRFIVFLNRVEDAQALEAARSVAQLIAQRGRAERILIGSALSPDPIQEVIQ